LWLQHYTEQQLGLCEEIDTQHSPGVIALLPVIMQLFATFALPRPDYLPV
jgi:hypothetical protein